MASHAAFLRGMNLGGRRITNVELCGHFSAMGFAEVAAFRASGNVVFEAAGDEAVSDMQGRVERGLAAALGYDVPTFVRDAGQLRAIAAFEPFDEHQRGLAGKLQVALLAAKPTRAARAATLELAGEQDALALEKTELYWLPAGPMSQSELDLKAIEHQLGPMTIRTMGTIQQITAKHFSA
jgi:uncharacterized protein (DUF1697 family)